MRRAIKRTLVQFDMEDKPLLNLVPDYGGSNIFPLRFQYCPWCGTSTERLT
jgi:hypothetical protein